MLYIICYILYEDLSWARLVFKKIAEKVGLDRAAG